MGNVCCGAQDESKKAGAFADNRDERERLLLSSQDQVDSSAASRISNNSAVLSFQQQQQQQQSSLPAVIISPEEQKQENERLQALREEQARLELIVQATGRGMVAVRSTRGTTGYYDQGFAAALSQHLEQTTQFPQHLPITLPPAASSSSLQKDSVYARLAAPVWHGIALGDNKRGMAGLAGENPETYVNHVAESYLDSVRPKQERLFRGVGPIVENLL
jgi:hypothetical protein